MNYTVYKGSQPVGEATIEPAGLYYEIRCMLREIGPVQRLYGIRGIDVCCLGVPDKNGKLQRWIPRKYVPAPERVIVSDVAPGKWKPWSGAYFGPMLYDCFLCSTDQGWSLAIGQEEWEGLSQWKDMGKKETVGGRLMICVDLGTDGQPARIDIENGGEENEKIHNPNYGDDIDPLLLAELPADYDYGGTGTEEADRHHL